MEQMKNLTLLYRLLVVLPQSKLIAAVICVICLPLLSTAMKSWVWRCMHQYSSDRLNPRSVLVVFWDVFWGIEKTTGISCFKDSPLSSQCCKKDKHQMTFCWKTLGENGSCMSVCSSNIQELVIVIDRELEARRSYTWHFLELFLLFLKHPVAASQNTIILQYNVVVLEGALSLWQKVFIFNQIIHFLLLFLKI